MRHVLSFPFMRMYGQNPNSNNFLISLLNALKQTHPLENDTPAVLTTESVHVTIDNRSSSASPKTISPKNSAISGSSSVSSLNNNNNNNNLTKQRPVNVTQPNLNLNKTSQPAVIELPSNNVIMSGTASNNTLRTIELSSGRIREGFGKFPTVFPVEGQNMSWVLHHYKMIIILFYI